MFFFNSFHSGCVALRGYVGNAEVVSLSESHCCVAAITHALRASPRPWATPPPAGTVAHACDKSRKGTHFF